MTYDEIIIYGVGGFILFGAVAPLSASLADRFSRSLLVIYHFGIGMHYLSRLHNRFCNWLLQSV